MKVVGAALAIGKEYSPGVVVDLRVADGTLPVVEEDAEPSCSNVQSAQLAHRAKELLVFVVGVIAEVLVPVAACAGLAGGEDDLIDIRHRAGEKFLEQAW